MSEINIKRRYLVFGSAVIGAGGLLMSSIPFVESLNPSAKALSGGGPVQIDISKIQSGQQITVAWRQKPVWILRRSAEMLKVLDSTGLKQKLRDPKSEVKTQQPDYIPAEYRSIKDEFFIAVGLCTHLGCIPTFRADIAPDDLGESWQGGYYCPCHGSKYDFAGRVFKGVPAPTNLLVPPYRYLSDSTLEIGVSPLKKILNGSDSGLG
ncbi:Ubiquinol-cytochrome C reductase iron-sulfur subunit [hydrothermal vent metagenome]|uniref:Ubiquinol-cytochrome C reductase iron-sulfur subunit n=1 Tax=hydrothermal vent metagenome TaxID=652676 RepID=A0A3B0YLU1_9ZZZZ